MGPARDVRRPGREGGHPGRRHGADRVPGRPLPHRRRRDHARRRPRRSAIPSTSRAPSPRSIRARRSRVEPWRDGERRPIASSSAPGRSRPRRTPADRVSSARPVLQPVPLAHKSLADYTHIVGRPLIEEIRELAEPLRGKRVLPPVRATAFGGGVSEILYTLVPLMRDVGLEVEWQVIYGREEFFNATKLMHNALQGNPQDLTEEQWATWFAVQRDERARALAAAGTSASCTTRSPPAIARSPRRRRRRGSGAATSTSPRPTRPPSERLLPYLLGYDASLFHVATTCPPGWTAACNIVPPRSTRWRPRTWRCRSRTRTFVCEQFGIDVRAPDASARSRASTRGRTRSE